MTENYKAKLVEYIGIGILVVCGGIGVSAVLNGCEQAEYQHYTEKYKIDKQNEFQRLRTIEEITRTEGPKMSPEDLSKLLRDNHLDKEK